jgi:1-acyl-sn-glycerol-3-phosphate acyltransferase
VTADGTGAGGSPPPEPGGPPAPVIPLRGDPARAPGGERRPARTRRPAPRAAARRPGSSPVPPEPAAAAPPGAADGPPVDAPPADAAGAATPAAPPADAAGASTPAAPPATGAARPAGVHPDTGARPTRPEPPDDAALPAEWEATLAAALAFVRRRLTGDYAVDDFGFDAELTDNVLLPLLRPLYRTWFRVETIGLHHVPDEGGALVVANHSGTIPLDALMTSVALHDDHPAHRHLRMLGADLLFRLPVVGQLSRKHGSTLACTPDAERLLAAGELVGVWPEGFKGIGKPFADRYKLQRFGRGGFVTAALRTGRPIIPCSIVGAEETYPKIGDIAPLARLLNLPYFPVTPTFPLLGPLGAVPLPSKWLMEFGEPIPTAELGPDAADDPMLVFNLADQVRETIQHTLYRLLGRRRNAFRG